MAQQEMEPAHDYLSIAKDYLESAKDAMGDEQVKPENRLALGNLAAMIAQAEEARRAADWLDEIDNSINWLTETVGPKGRQRLTDREYQEKLVAMDSEENGGPIGNPLEDAARRWMRNGHMIGCYHSDNPEEGSPDCAIGCTNLLAALGIT